MEPKGHPGPAFHPNRTTSAPVAIPLVLGSKIMISEGLEHPVDDFFYFFCCLSCFLWGSIFIFTFYHFLKLGPNSEHWCPQNQPKSKNRPQSPPLTPGKQRFRPLVLRFWDPEKGDFGGFFLCSPLHCTAMDDPRAAIHWKRDGRASCS